MDERRTTSGGRLGVAALLLLLCGCAVPVTSFRIVDYREPGLTRSYRERFDEAYYRFDRVGDVDIVLRRSAAGRAGVAAPITQVIHVHGLWRCIPGRTVAHRTQINATVTYSVESGPATAVFRGAGSLFLDNLRPGGTLEGELELATLSPVYRSPAAAELFERAELSGRFTARHNPRRAVVVANEVKNRMARVE